MALKDDLVAIVINPTTEEAVVKAGAAKAYSLKANLDAAVKGCDDLARIITELAAKCPAGANKTALEGARDALV